MPLNHRLALIAFAAILAAAIAFALPLPSGLKPLPSSTSATFAASPTGCGCSHAAHSTQPA